MSKARTKKLGKNYSVPQSREEADRMIRELGEARRRVARIEADMNDELAAIKAKFEAEAHTDKAKIDVLTNGIEDWCAANRDRLTSGGKVKFAKFGSGEVKWRNRPPKVTVRGVEAVLEALKQLGLKQFIRVKEEVNKDAILADPEKARSVAGITVGPEGEDFVIEPFEDELSGEAA